MVGDARLGFDAANAERPLVVGYNAKQHSREALLWGAAEAVRQGVPLVVMFAANYPGMAVDPLEPGALEADEKVTTRGVVEALKAHPHLQVDGVTLVTSPTRALTEASAQAGLLVIGTRGYGPVVGALLGSVAFGVATQAACPVVVVKGEPQSRPIGPRHRVVVGTDGSSHSAAAVAFAAERAAVHSATLEVVTCTGEHPLPDVDPQTLWTAAEEIAQSSVDHVRDTHPALAVRTRVEDSPAERTLVAASADAGMVVVGTRGRGAFKGLLLGSVSHAVIHGAHCPVAVVGDGNVVRDGDGKEQR
jgi:nucleotide-binding universal stress UspA family protein